jgi:murein DD-endopeptidase MepM/ murein hydrolase activator NlpD
LRWLTPVLVAAVLAGGIVYYGQHHRTAEAAAPQPRPEADRPAEAPKIVMPINGLQAKAVQDTFDQSRGDGERRHEATDILAPRGTPVHAMVDGVIQKLFLSKPGGNTIYEFDNDAEYCYYYAHLDRYAEGLAERQRVRAGDVIGYVGTSGNADPNTPHLHLAIFRLGPQKHWWQGTPVNPYPTLMGLLRGR